MFFHNLYVGVRVYYFTNLTQVADEISARKQKFEEITQRVNGYVSSRYKIPNFTQKLAGLCPEANEYGWESPFNGHGTYGVLARQIPGICNEDVMSLFLSQRLGITLCSFAFSRDCFYTSSNDKMYRAKVPMYSWSKKGKLVVEYDHVVDCGRKYHELDMIRMDKLMTTRNVSLAEHHRLDQELVFGLVDVPYVWGDVSYFYASVLCELAKAEHNDMTVWRDNGAGKDVLVRSYSLADARNLTVRPCADWYYGMYLSMFLNGSMILFETYDNETGGVPKIRAKFEREMESIKSAVGVYPIVVKIPPLTKDMLHVNKHLLEDTALCSDLVLGGISTDTTNTLEYCEQLKTHIQNIGRTYV